MKRIIFFMFLVIGCSSYQQIDKSKPHAIIEAKKGVRITKIDGQRASSGFSGKHAFRVSPGLHKVSCEYAHDGLKVENSNSSVAEVPVNTEEGYIYYIIPKFNYKYTSVLFGVGYNGTDSWKPILKEKMPINKANEIENIPDKEEDNKNEKIKNNPKKEDVKDTEKKETIDENDPYKDIKY